MDGGDQEGVARPTHGVLTPNGPTAIAHVSGNRSPSGRGVCPRFPSPTQRHSANDTKKTMNIPLLRGAQEGGHPDPERIISSCSRALAPYKVPKQVIVVENLPKNPSEKILKWDVRLQLHAK